MSRAVISPIDRLGLTLFFAASIHAVAILGISFSIEKPQKQPPPERTIDIMVVQNPKKSEPPKKADFLAQTNQQGGGSEKQKARPTTQAPHPAPQVAPLPQRPSPPRPARSQPKPSKPERVITQKRKTEKKVTTQPVRKEKAPKKRKLTTADLLASTSQEIERLTAELDRKTRAYARRPRRKAINASTQEYKYANYLDAWRRKVEKIGNLNYPDEAKRRKLHGSLLLHVALKADGSIYDIRIIKSSGHKLLDDAAIRIVRLAAPFAPFPAEIREEVQILDITRTWQFKHNDRLFSK